MIDRDADLMVFDLMMVAHAWALKHWHFGPLFTIDEFIQAQVRMFLPAVVVQRRLTRYTSLLST